MYVTICGRFCPDEGAVAGYDKIKDGKATEFGQNLPQSKVYRLQGILIKRQVALNKE